MICDKIPAVVLAGQRSGKNPNKEHFGPFTTVGGKYAINHVLESLQNSEEIEKIVVVAEQNRHSKLLSNTRLGKKLEVIVPELGPSLSAQKALKKIKLPSLLTSGDHPLLSIETIKYFLGKSLEKEADLTVGIVPHSLLLEKKINEKRTRYRFKDGDFCGANLFLFKTAEAKEILTIWNKIEAARKKPWMVICFFGVSFLITYLFGRLDCKMAENFLRKKTGLVIKFIKLDCFKAAIDLDSKRDYRLIEKIMKEG